MILRNDDSKLRFYSLVWAALLLFVVQCAKAATFYVSPQGNDRWSGRLAEPNRDRADGPLASLSGARDAIRRLKSKGPLTKPVRVIVADGTYTLAEPFVLKPQDSGTKNCPITYEAAAGVRPVFTGGRVIRDFKQGENGVWQTHIPGVAAGKWYFEQLFVNGRRAVRARTPNKFYHYMGATSEILIEGKQEQYRRTTSVRSDALGPLRNLDSRELRDVTLVAYHKFRITRRFITAIDTSANTIITIGEKLTSYSGWPINTRFHLENFKAALDAPGEWFLARDGTLYYKPLSGEDMTKAEVVAPVVEKFVIFQGKPNLEQFVEHIQLKGLVFHHNQLLLPASGYAPLAAPFLTEAVIMADGARNVVVEDCEIGHIATYSVWFRRGCRDCRLEGCYLHDLGAGGVRIGEEQIRPDQLSNTSHITVDNNIIRSGGRIYASAAGVWVGQSGDNTVTHNDISDFFYTGISVGWCWSYSKTLFQRENKIESNHIHHLMNGVLSDGGGIYTLGYSPGSTIRYNLIHDIYHYPFTPHGSGIYLDQASEGYLIENNIVYRVGSSGFFLHWGQNNIIRNNIFAYPNDEGLKRGSGRDKQYLTDKPITFEKNIIYVSGGYVITQSRFT